MLHQTLLNRILVIISKAATLDEAFQDVLQQVCQTTAWEFGEVWMPDPEAQVLRMRVAWDGNDDSLLPFRQASEAFEFPWGVGLPGRVAATQQPEWIPDVASQSEAIFLRAKTALAVGLRAGLGVPILAENQVLAVLVFFMADVCLEDQSQVELVCAIATHLGSVIQLKQTQAALLSSEQRLQTLIDSLPGIVFVASNDQGWSMTYLSQGCLKLTGYSSSELTHPAAPVSYNTITHADDLPHVLQAIDAAIAQRQTYEVEYRIRTKDGTEKWLWEKGYGVFNPAGQVLGIEGFITDITQLKQVERALRDQESFLQLVLDNIPQHIFWKDCQLTYQGANKIWLESLGYAESQQIVGKTDNDLWPPDLAETYRAADRQVIRQKQPRLHVIGHRLQPNGQSLWQDISKVPIHNAEGDVVGILGMFEDVTEQYRAQEHLAQREQHLAALVEVQRLLLNWTGGNSVDLYRRILPILAETAGASRAYVLECMTNQVTQRSQLVQQAVWCRAGVSAIAVCSHLQHLFFQGNPHSDSDLSQPWVDRLAADDVINLSTDQDGRCAETCGILAPLNVCAMLVLPLKANGQLWGAMVFERRGESCAYSEHAHPEHAHPDRSHPDYSHSDHSQLDHLYPDYSENKTSSSRIQAIPKRDRKESQSWSTSEVDLLRAAAAATSLAYEHQRTKRFLKQAEAKYRSIFENSVEGIFQSTPDGRYLIANPMLAQIYGYDSPADLMQSVTNIEQQLYVDRQRRTEFTRLIHEHGAIIGFESQIYRKDGSVIWISESARTLYDADGIISGYEGTVEDITQRKHAEEELLKRDNLLQGVAEAATCLLTQVDLDAAIPQVLEILGQAAVADRVYIYENHPHPDTAAIAMSMRYEWTATGVAPSIHQSHWQNLPYQEHGLDRWYAAFQRGQSIRGVVRQFPDAEQALLQRDRIRSILMVPIFIAAELWGYIGFDACCHERIWTANEESILVAIAASLGGALKRQRTEDEMRYQAFHDSLTGLPNRMLFNQQLPFAIAKAKQGGEMLAVLFLDLDRFKTINDTLGHAVGDELLKQVTQRFQTSLRADDLVARWGGDEFTMILPRITRPQEAADLAQKIINHLKPSFPLAGHDLYVTSSIGIALYPQDGDDLKTLLQNADAALYRAKDQGRNHYQFYTTTLNSQATERLRLENYLHHALELNEMQLHYQPQVNARTGEITKMEALLRWQHRELGLISPSTFIPLAEETGLILPLGEWVLETACRQNRAWQAAGLPPIRVAVNLSARQFQQPQLVERITQILASTQLAPDYLELEITETAAMQDVDLTSNVLHELRRLGVRISIDDFGTGYSSLAYLKRFPLHTLKIDQSFVRDLIDRPDDEAIVAAIVALSRGFNLSVVAEGVETVAHVQRLQALECEEMQGFWFSCPLRSAAATAFLQQHHQGNQLIFPMSD